MSGRLEGKVALITGAARGIGRAQAVRFAEEGAAVIAVDLGAPVDTVAIPAATHEDLDETRDLVERAGGRAIVRCADVRDGAALDAAVAAGVAEFGGLDVVCASAGITSRAPAVEMTEQMWRTMIDVNLTGVWQTCRAAAPRLIDRGAGSIVLTNSIAGLRGLVGVAHYAAAKHGCVGLMRSLAQELAPHRVRVNSIHPTTVRTPMIMNDVVRGNFTGAGAGATDEAFEAAARRGNLLDVPWVEPEDVANAALFLASEEARYITSVSLPVDAGSTQR